MSVLPCFDVCDCFVYVTGAVLLKVPSEQETAGHVETLPVWKHSVCKTQFYQFQRDGKQFLFQKHDLNLNNGLDTLLNQ